MPRRTGCGPSRTRLAATPNGRRPHPCALDERLYFPEPNTPKQFDAVYTGRFAPLKRHELAAEVPAIAVLTADYNVDFAAALNIRNGYRDLKFCNLGETGDFRKLAPEEVRKIICASYCGLALSEVEGAMFAFSEYALCGIPQVSTPCTGGRELFFDGEFTEIADPDPGAVKDAVARLKSRRIDPFDVRARALARIRPHRERFIERLSRIMERDLTGLADGNLWLPQFTDKLRIWRNADRAD